MKRVLLVSVLLMVSLAIVSAKNKKTSFTFKGGDKSVFAREVVANVIIDDYKVLIDGKNQTADVYYGNQGEEVYAKFVSDLNVGHASFIAYFNEEKPESVKLSMAADSAADAEYTCKVTVTSMNVGNAAGMFVGMSRKAGGVLIDGCMQFVDNATGEVVCEWDFAGVKGLMSPAFMMRVVSVYRYLADGLLKEIQ